MDPVEHGAHLDMDIFTFINSSISLRNYLHQAALLGIMSRSANLSLIFEELREYGKKLRKQCLLLQIMLILIKEQFFHWGYLLRQQPTAYSI